MKKGWLSIWYEYLLQVIFPVTCVGCGSEQSWTCDTCRITIPDSVLRCPGCDVYTTDGKTCLRCRRSHALDGLWVAAPFDNPIMRELIHMLKYGGISSVQYDLQRLLADRLAVRPLPDNNVSTVVIPIPLHPRRERERGYNQAALLAKIVASCLNAPYIPNGLVRTKYTKTQTQYAKQERIDNLKDAFRIHQLLAISHKRVILVDDVATTGATLEQAASVLKSAGAHSVWGCVCSRGTFHTHSPTKK